MWMDDGIQNLVNSNLDGIVLSWCLGNKGISFNVIADNMADQVAQRLRNAMIAFIYE